MIFVCLLVRLCWMQGLFVFVDTPVLDQSVGLSPIRANEVMMMMIVTYLLLSQEHFKYYAKIIAVFHQLIANLCNRFFVHMLKQFLQ